MLTTKPLDKAFIGNPEIKMDEDKIGYCITTISVQYRRLHNQKQRKLMGHVLDLLREEPQRSQMQKLKIGNHGGPI